MRLLRVRDHDDSVHLRREPQSVSRGQSGRCIDQNVVGHLSQLGDQVIHRVRGEDLGWVVRRMAAGHQHEARNLRLEECIDRVHFARKHVSNADGVLYAEEAMNPRPCAGRTRGR